MSKRISTVAALVGAAGLLSGCNFQQPSFGCQVQDSASWQAAYFLTNPADASKSCGKLPGEAVGVFKYVNPETGLERVGLRPNGAAVLVAFTNLAGNPTQRTDPTTATALSTNLTAEPDAKGLCDATGFPLMQVNARAVGTDEAKTALPAQTVSYQYNTLQVYSTAAAPGTLLQGTFTYSDGAGCSAEYRMVAQWPRIECDIDAFNNPTPENRLDRCGTGEGSFLNPDVQQVCVAGIGPGGAGGCVPNPNVDFPPFVGK